jgi:Tfp pilus assembly protein PilF
VGLNGSLFAQTPDLFQPDIPALLVAKVDDANKKVEIGDLGAAEKELKDVLQQRPDYYRALVNLGLIYLNQNRPAAAIQTLEEAKKLRDSLHISDSSILNSLGWIYMVTNRFKEAETYFHQALREGHDNPSETERVLNNLGYLYLLEGDTTKARVYLQKSINDYHSTGAQKVLKMTEQYDESKKADQQKMSERKTPPD